MLDPVEPYDIREVSAITHAHPVAEWSCVTLCDMLWTIRNSGTPAKVDFWRRYGHIVSRPVEAVKSDGYCEHTLEAALWCFMNTGSYADCVLTAVNLGDDTDTTAAVAGALAGVYYGFEAIPPKWVGGGKADMGIRCPNCGEQIGFHAGHINNGRVFVCEKGKPLMREVRCYCRHCDSTVIFLKKCEPEGVNHD